MKVQTAEATHSIMTDDWRNNFLPPESIEVETAQAEFVPTEELQGDAYVARIREEELNNVASEDDILAELGAEDREEALERVVAKLLEEGPEAQLAVIGQNQQRIMEAIDNMASGFSSQLVILARRIDNFERVLDQAQGQPTMTNLMFDAPEVFNKVVNRDVEEKQDEPVELEKAIEPATPDPDFFIPDEIEGMLNFDATFPVSIEVQAAFWMWKEKLSSFQNFVKVAGGPVAAKKARGHLE